MSKKRATRRRSSAPKSSYKAWLRHHQLCLRDAFFDVIRQPVSSAMTWLVIAIALLLPALLFLGLKTAHQYTDQWQEGGQITLYLNEAVTNEQAQSLLQELMARPEILQGRFISADQAWAEFSQQIQVGQTLTLDKNPLPASLVLVPKQQSASDLEALVITLQDLPELDDIQLDLIWIERLNQILGFLTVSVNALAMLLSLAVLLIVGNTIRLAIESRKDEVQVFLLLGATHRYVRRPFLYLGAWYGAFGGLVGCVLLWLVSRFLGARLTPLLQSYGQDSVALTLHPTEPLLLLLASVLISLIGARLALWRHIRAIEHRPS